MKYFETASQSNLGLAIYAVVLFILPSEIALVLLTVVSKYVLDEKELQ